MGKHISGTSEKTFTSGAVIVEKTLDRPGDVQGRRTPREQLINRGSDRRFRPAKNRGTTLAKQFQICVWWMPMVWLSLCLAGCNKPHAAAPGPPAPEVTVSKATEKEVVNWDEFTGRTAAVNLVTMTPRVSGYIVD